MKKTRNQRHQMENFTDAHGHHQLDLTFDQQSIFHSHQRQSVYSSVRSFYISSWKQKGLAHKFCRLLQIHNEKQELLRRAIQHSGEATLLPSHKMSIQLKISNETYNPIKCLKTTSLDRIQNLTEGRS